MVAFMDSVTLEDMLIAFDRTCMLANVERSNCQKRQIEKERFEFCSRPHRRSVFETRRGASVVVDRTNPPVR